jgi:hypothetical protein
MVCLLLSYYLMRLNVYVPCNPKSSGKGKGKSFSLLYSSYCTMIHLNLEKFLSCDLIRLV